MRNRYPRKAAVLMEVLLACVILSMSLLVLSTLSNAGTRMAVLGELQTRALIRCETTLNELIVGTKEIPRSEQSFYDDPMWRWNAIADEDESGLNRVSVSVWREGLHAEASRVELVRLMPVTWTQDDSFDTWRLP